MYLWLLFVGAVKVINSRETVPRIFRQDLLKQCPKYITFATGLYRYFINNFIVMNFNTKSVKSWFSVPVWPPQIPYSLSILIN